MQYPTDPTDGGFLDLAAGGFDLKSATNKGEYSLFALHRRGSLVIRKGIRSNSSPEGTHWSVVDDIPSEDNSGDVEQISKITCSHSYGNLIVITWDGRLFYRSGITVDRREGTAWSKIELPVSAPIVDICLGRNALWMSSANGMLWFRKVVNRTIGAHYELNTKTPESYVQMGDRMCRVAISRDDRVLAIDKTSERQFLRSNVTTNELSGRQWIEIIANSNKENIEWNQVDFGNLNLCENGFPRLWTDPNFVKQSENAVSDRRSEWRSKIIERLDVLADKVWNTSRDHPSPYAGTGDRTLSVDGKGEEAGQWVLKANVQVMMLPSKNQSKKVAAATLAMQSLSEGYLAVDFRDKTRFKASFKEILCVSSTGLSNGKPSLRILFSGDGKSSKAITLDFTFDSEEDRDKWKNQMQKVILALVQSEPRSIDKRYMWFIDAQGSPRVGFLSTLHIGQQPDKVELVPLAKCRWLQLPGHFTAVSSSSGLAYAISSDGELWNLSRDFDLMREIDADLDLTQTDTVTEVIYEHEKKSRLSGFCTFNGRANGLYFAWSDKTGLVQKRKEDCRLPSREWIKLKGGFAGENGEEDATSRARPLGFASMRPQ
uniref:PH domain-containing protein n=1 Tax=Steinernema glaseri TaxID=37863 RepID=A0A1I8A8T4_9BILA